MKIFISLLLFVSSYSAFCQQFASPFSSVNSIDTLEIFVIYTQFKEEIPDNILTTGVGLFDSDFDTKFTLNPRGFRQYRAYLQKNLEFAQKYYRKLSGGRLHIRWQFFPNPNITTGKIENPISLSKTLSFYNPSPLRYQNKANFNDVKEIQYLSFVAETLRRVKNLAVSPFSIAMPSSRTRRSYLIFHAGHSRLTNKSSGPNDTPNDLIDVFLNKDDFLVLNKVDELNVLDSLLAQRKDSLGVVVSDSQVIDQVMILSESASQDGVNFGINGILINQIARQIGLPNVWNMENGFPQVGLFDLMDFGQFALSGFVPVYPSAWHRVFMGWENLTKVYPLGNASATYTVTSPDAILMKGGKSVLQISLNDQEYLLIENRQQALQDSVSIYFSYPLDQNDFSFSGSDSVRIPLTFVDSLFLDSICNSNRCNENWKRPKGVITGVSDYDMGIPASGLLIWKINKGSIQRTLEKGFVNRTQNGEIDIVGIQLVEADGNHSLQSSGKNNVGQTIFDLGSGADIFPHIRYDKLDPSIRDTILSLNADDFVNTQSSNQGRTHISLETTLPNNPLLLKSTSFTGDSILTVLSTELSLTVHWNTNTNIKYFEDSKWPRKSISSSNLFNHMIIALKDTVLIPTISDEGFVQFFNLQGEPVSQIIDTVVNLPTIRDYIISVNAIVNDTFLIYGISQSLNPIKSSALLQDSILVLNNHKDKIYTINVQQERFPSFNAFKIDSLEIVTKIVPLIYKNLIWLVTTNKLLAYDVNLNQVYQITIPPRSYQDQALISLENNEWGIVLVDSLAQFMVVNLNNQNIKMIINTQNLEFVQEKFTLQVSDFDRDGIDEFLMLGSFGTMTMKTVKGKTMPGFPLFISRTDQTKDTIFQDDIPASLGDITNDGFIEILITIPNGIQAISYQGEKMWKFLTDKKQGSQNLRASPLISSKLLLSSPLIIYMNRNVNREPIVLLTSPNGLIWAIDGKGQPLLDYHGSSSSTSTFPSALQLDWPLSIGGIGDTSRINAIQLSIIKNKAKNFLFGQTSFGGSYLWEIMQLHENQQGAWRGVKGGFKRQARLDVKTLLIVPAVNNLQNIIHSFFIYPSPLSKRKKGTIRINLGASAQSIMVKILDISGAEVFRQYFGSVSFAGQHDFLLHLPKLGVDIYLALVEVHFLNGEKKTKSQRFGIIH